MTDTSAYDPDARRDTPLGLKIKDIISREGPIPVHRYVALCLNDPEHGYYRHRQAIGRSGDFITAPEISQVFGELIGLWCVVVWQQMGKPDPFHLIELGPGRGTLMRDALRAAKLAPSFLKSAQIKLVETNATLREQQKAALADAPHEPQWFNTLAAVPLAPSIIIANEFLDTIPPLQSVVTAEGVAARGVGLDAHGDLQFVPMMNQLWANENPNAGIGTIHETQLHAALSDSMGLRSYYHPQVALLIDYGDIAPEQGDTLQAVRDHRYEHPLTSPGEADLSVQVNFLRVAEQLKRSALAGLPEANPVTIDGLVTQAFFLASLGIVERTQKLIAANPAQANAIETAVARLMAPNGMGTRFKVLGVRSASVPPLPSFPVAHP